MMLWNLLNYANTQKFSFVLYSLQPGELLLEVPNGIPCFTAPQQPLGYAQRILNKVKRKFQKKGVSTTALKSHILKVHKRFQPDAWYLNTMLCAEVSTIAHELSIPHIVHFHELPSLYQLISYQQLEQMTTHAKLLIGCAQSVCDKLKIMSKSSIALQYECVNIDAIKPNAKKTQALKEALNPRDKFVWIMSGTIAYRKGTDLIPAIAQQLGEDSVLLWVGPGSSGYSYYIEQELKEYGVSNAYFLGAKSDDYYEYLSLADGLVLTSREDPFPLVMIEAAALGKPIVAFNSGGVTEFVKSKMGIVVDSQNTTDLVDAMKQVMKKTIEFDEQVAISRAKEFDAKVQVKNWEDLLANHLRA